MFGIACRYEDSNDSTRLATDPVQRLLIERDPAAGQLLVSQLKLSRLDNQIDGRLLAKMGHAICEKVIARHPLAVLNDPTYSLMVYLGY